jgi:hypothetical protein
VCLFYHFPLLGPPYTLQTITRCWNLPPPHNTTPSCGPLSHFLSIFFANPSKRHPSL